MKMLPLLIALSVSLAANAMTTAEQRGLHFSHTLHVETNSFECAQCHVAVEQSRTGSDNLLPYHPQCAECHDVAAANNCTMCHLNAAPEPQSPIIDYSPKFTHLAHVAGAKLECSVCHKDLDQPLDTEHRGHFPNMAECMACHEQRTVSTACATCHTPKEDLRPRDHLVNWLQTHGAVASADEETRCNQCHNRVASKAPDCQNCHNGDQVFFQHPRNYISRHGQDAQLSDLSCSVCHEDREDCNRCHREMNIYPASHQHADWAIPGEGGEHTAQAAADLESCMSCHDTPGQEPACVRCHGK